MESSLSFRCIGGPLRPNLLYVVGSLLLSHILLAQDRAELNALLEPVPHGTPYNERTITTAFDSRVSRDPQNAVRLLLNAANTGDPGAQTSLGYLYAKGKAVPKDEEQALRWFQRAAADNYAPAQYDLGLLLLQAGAHHDENAAVRWLTRAAQQGLAPAQVNLGILYVRGIGVVRDEAEALRWFRKAGKQRFAYAEFLLGMAYEGGNGVKRDFTEAVRWYHKAAEQGHAQAQNNLAGLYRDGVGVAKNVNEALKWYRSAAEQGESTSYSNYAPLF